MCFYYLLDTGCLIVYNALLTCDDLSYTHLFFRLNAPYEALTKNATFVLHQFTRKHAKF